VKSTPKGLAAALRARALQKRPPTDADRPPPSTLPGPKRRPLPGQLDFYGNETPGLGHPDTDDEEATP
jgi:hypothetical protein